MMNVTGSYGRSSPDTIGPSYSKDVTYTGEVMGNYANGSVSNSYGITFMPIKNSSFALRASTTTTTTLRTSLALMATLTTTVVGMPRIPTGYNENRYTNSSIPIYFSILL